MHVRVVSKGVVFVRGDGIVLRGYRCKGYSCGCGKRDVIIVSHSHAVFVRDFEIADNIAVCKVVLTDCTCRGGEDERQNVSLAYTVKDVVCKCRRQSLSVVFFVKDDICLCRHVFFTHDDFALLEHYVVFARYKAVGVNRVFTCG